VWSGSGNDVFTVDGTHRSPGLRTTTSLNTGLGNDRVTVNLDAATDGFFVLHTQGAVNNLLPVVTAISSGDHRIPADRVRVFLDGTELASGDFVFNPADNTVGLFTGTQAGLGALVRVDVWSPVLERFHVTAESVSSIAYTTALTPADEARVFLDGRLLTAGVGYTLDLAGNRILFAPGYEPLQNAGVTLEVWSVVSETFTIPQVAFTDDDVVDASGSSLPLIVFGGQGVDRITGGSGRDILFGDRGRVEYRDANGVLVAFFGNAGPGDFTDGVIRPVSAAYSVDPTIGGGDVLLAGAGGNLVIGGAGADQIEANSDSLADYVLGDNGSMLFNAGILARMETTAPAIGGNDRILVGEGDDVVLGGVGTDYINVDPTTLLPIGTDSGDDVILGDNGVVVFDTTTGASVIQSAVTTDPDHGAGDYIFAANGSDVVLGGSGADVIDAGTDSGRDIVVGDNGQALFDLHGVLREIRTTIPATGGDDIILVGDGDDVVLGGVGTDYINVNPATLLPIDTDSGDDVIIGDNGFVLFDTSTGVSVILQAETTDPDQGARDYIFAANGADVVLGGSGADVIDAGTDTSRDIVVGDNGQALFDLHGVLREIRTTVPATGGDDVILVGDGDDVVLGGVGTDYINIDPITLLPIGTDSGGDVILGDNGFVLFDTSTGVSVIQQAETTDPDQGARDFIFASNGSDVVLGGSGADVIDAGTDTGRDIVVGDNGQALFDLHGVLREIRTTVPATGGDDVILVGDGDDVVLGGVGTDYINVDPITLLPVGTDSGDDVILGDNGFVLFDTSTGVSVIQQAETSDPEHGADDYIFASNGSDVVLGGSGADVIDAGTDIGRDIVVGDNGQALFDIDGVLREIRTTIPDTGGDDQILVADGDDVVLGGVGTDYINIDPVTLLPIGSDSGDDVILGDNGFVFFDTSTGFSIIQRAETSDPVDGAADYIFAADGADVVLGGTGADVIDAGTDGSRDIVVGDNGQALFSLTGVVLEITSTDETFGGDDRILTGAGSDVVVGGLGLDFIDAGDGPDTGEDIVTGDHAHLLFNEAGYLLLVESTFPTFGADDVILTGGGDDVVIGGLGADDINTGNDTGSDIVLGDLGRIEFRNLFTGRLVDHLASVLSTEPALGGNDEIETGNGADVVVGGIGRDTIRNTGDRGNDILFGDNARITFAGLTRPLNVSTLAPQIGGNDLILAGDGTNFVAGGRGADDIKTGSGRDFILGDNGTATFAGAFVITRIATTDAGQGGNDDIDSGNGADVVFGGTGADTITSGVDASVDTLVGDHGVSLFSGGVITRTESLDPAVGGSDRIFSFGGPDAIIGGPAGDVISDTGSRDVILGDNGIILYRAGIPYLAESTFPSIGGNDTIDALGGSASVVGGAGGDTIRVSGGGNAVLGDNGIIETNGSGRIVRMESTDPGAGGDDDITGGEGEDVIFGGTGGDNIRGNGGDDILFGDHGTYRGGGARGATSTFTGQGGNDRINGGGGDDYILGQVGGDTIDGGSGDDDIIGGHNVPGGSDGGDTLRGGGGDDVLVGDNAQITRPGGTHPFIGGPLRSVELFFDGEGGNDRIYGDDGNDILYGLLGADYLDGGAGFNLIYAEFDDTWGNGLLMLGLTSLNTWLQNTMDEILARNTAFAQVLAVRDTSGSEASGSIPAGLFVLTPLTSANLNAILLQTLFDQGGITASLFTVFGETGMVRVIIIQTASARMTIIVEVRNGVAVTTVVVEDASGRVVHEGVTDARLGELVSGLAGMEASAAIAIVDAIRALPPPA
jgi:Ca2+-binding RTX toxin-like protein